MKIKLSELRKLINEAIIAEVSAGPELTADIDSALKDLQVVLKTIESAHGKAPDPAAKVVLMGVHSDLFNAAAFLRKVKTGNIS